MTELSELGLRERKKRETRRSLQRHALRLVAERGLEGVTVEEIAAAANVSPRTFFNYFSAKEEALIGDGHPVHTGQARDVFVAGGPTGKLVEDLKFFLVKPLEGYAPSVEEVRLRKRLMHEEPRLLPVFTAGFAATEQAVAEAVAERIGAEPTDLRPQLFAAVGATAMRFSLRRWVSGEHEYSDLRSILTETFDELKKGLSGS